MAWPGFFFPRSRRTRDGCIRFERLATTIPQLLSDLASDLAAFYWTADGLFFWGCSKVVRGVQQFRLFLSHRVASDLGCFLGLRHVSWVKRRSRVTVDR